MPSRPSRCDVLSTPRLARCAARPLARRDAPRPTHVNGLVITALACSTSRRLGWQRIRLQSGRSGPGCAAGASPGACRPPPSNAYNATREIPLQRRACLFRGRARWRDLRGRARSVRAPPPPAPPRPHATARALRPSVTCNLERLVCRLHRCAVTSVCRLRQMVCHPPPHTAQRTTGARLSPCRTKNSQHNTQQVLVFSPLIQRTGNKKKKVVRAAFPHFSSIDHVLPLLPEELTFVRIEGLVRKAPPHTTRASPIDRPPPPAPPLLPP